MAHCPQRQANVCAADTAFEEAKRLWHAGSAPAARRKCVSACPDSARQPAPGGC